MAMDKKVFAISKKDDTSIATGFKTAYSNGDGTYTVEFIDGTKVVTAPIKGDKGDGGIGIKNVTINADGHLIVTMTDDTEVDAGKISGGGSGTQIQADFNQTDNTKVDFIKNKPNMSDYVEKDGTKVLSTNDYTNEDKDEVAKVKNKLDTVSLTDQSLKKIHLYDDFEIVSNGTDLPRLHWSDGEVIFGGDNVQIHSVAGEESRVTVGDGILKLEGSPYNTKNATLELGLDGNYKSYINITADDIAINGNPLSVSPEIFHVVGLPDKGVTPGGDGHSVTVKELWDAGVRSGTYIIFCHSNTSTSQKFFIGYIDIWAGTSNNPSINDTGIINLTDNTAHMRYGTYDGEERLFYTGGDEGSICFMDFIKFSSYVDN